MVIGNIWFSKPIDFMLKSEVFYKINGGLPVVTSSAKASPCVIQFKIFLPPINFAV